ncbi:alpha/beta hydrolase fold domain-containing protein [Novosphingobium sp. FSY-8]|uniref:Alpha/beta hydrolase fold domain-containing protein n=1 Tax=Novosphingobium ovatum TaxID=1908523 RepID=A0ABW9XCB0_9SPHN|nr:alpha/beta hydrolase fold domain-containing protein [Novosphingobium ovatum]
MVAAAALTTATLATAVSAAKPRDFPVDARPVLEDRYPARVQHWPGNVTSLADVTYQTIPGYRPMVIDIYMPATAPKSPKPLVLYVHGGGWVGGHTRHAGAMANFPAALARLASEGFVVASLEYRLAGEAPFPAQLQDARAALRFLKGNAARYGIDPARTGIWGGSAGGHLSALTALSCGDKTLDAHGAATTDGDTCVQAAVIWYGVFDFGALSASRPGGSDPAGAKLLNCTGPCSTEAYAKASPVTYITPKAPPFLLIHGEEDKTVPVAQSHLVEARLRANGTPVEAIYIPAVDHSFIGATPAVTRSATLRAMNATFDFLHARLDRKGTRP